jgi:hypothetical protein
VKILALDIAERETIIRALDDPHPASRSSGECCSPNTSAASATGSPDNVVKRTSSRQRQSEGINPPAGQRSPPATGPMDSTWHSSSNAGAGGCRRPHAARVRRTPNS